MIVLEVPCQHAESAVAAAYYARNRAALAPLTQVAANPVSWLRARDGSLTCKTENGKWLLGNSLPLRTAERMLRDLRISQSVSCFLDVPHAAFIRLALQRLEKTQAIIAIVPDEVRLHIMLHCEDFSDALTTGRLAIVGGETWADQLAKVFVDHPGLATPSSFIRTSLSEEHYLQSLITVAEKIFAMENQRRTLRISECVNQPARSIRERKEICLIAPSAFRLWDHTTHVLESLFPGKAFDSDLPRNTSPLALSMAAADCDAVIAANISRADAVGLVACEKPWITWVTRPVIPAYTGMHRDHLLLADERWRENAQKLSWPEEQISIASWPEIFPSPPCGNYLALIANTLRMDPDTDRFEMSSHGLLWETIRQHLTANPFAMQTDPGAFLADTATRFDVTMPSSIAAEFIERLIIPVYQQALAALVLQSGLPLRLYGSGWNEIPEFAPHTGGVIKDMQSMRTALNQTAALIHAWPVRHAHAVDAVGLPVVHGAEPNSATFLQKAKFALHGKWNAATPSPSCISAEMILSRIHSGGR